VSESAGVNAPWRIAWSHGRAAIEPVGAMLGPVEFRLPDGRNVQPFDIFPWADEPTPHGEVPPTGLMARGRGEWPCVPFGYPRPAEALAPDWAACGMTPGDDPPHGYGANAPWTVTDRSADAIALEIAYPETSPIVALRRWIAGSHGEPGLRLALEIEVRRACRLPIGLHPTFRMPGAPGGLTVAPGRFAFGMTWPGDLEPGASRLAMASRFDSLAAVPLRVGGRIDLTRLPLPEPVEELVLLCGVDGHVALRNEHEGYAVRLAWDPVVLPSCVLWISNGGRTYWPWNGRHYGLGVEPVCAAFDLGVDASVRDNPLKPLGVPTAVALAPGAVWRTEYAISVIPA
jgi:hypothetical protein